MKKGSKYVVMENKKFSFDVCDEKQFYEKEYTVYHLGNSGQYC